MAKSQESVKDSAEAAEEKRRVALVKAQAEKDRARELARRDAQEVARKSQPSIIPHAPVRP